MPLYLVPIEYPESPIPIDKPVLLIGRQAECDVILTCSRKVSRRHCCVVQISDWYVLRDLGSTNGIGINGESVANEARFEIGDQINVGDVAFDLVEGKFDVPKGKVCIGPKLNNPPKVKAEEQRESRPSKANSFRGIPSSRRQRNEGSPNEKRRLAELSAEAADDMTDYEEPDSELPIGPPDDFGSETFGSDAGDQLDDKIEETFGSDMPGSDRGEPPVPGYDDNGGESPFAFMDEADLYDSDDDDQDNDDQPERNESKSKSAGRSKPRRKSVDQLDDETEAYDDDSDAPDDFVYDEADDAEPVKRTPKQRKRRPRDASLADDERLQDDVDVKKSSGGNSNNADSIIELDEFDLLD